MTARAGRRQRRDRQRPSQAAVTGSHELAAGSVAVTGTARARSLAAQPSGGQQATSAGSSAVGVDDWTVTVSCDGIRIQRTG